jgi:hypothetical protein
MSDQMRLLFYPAENTAILAPEGWKASPGYRTLAELTKDPPKEGHTYLVPFTRTLTEIVFRYREGVFKPLLRLGEPWQATGQQTLLEFPTHQMTPAEIPPLVAQVITSTPASTRVIKPLLRQLGVPLPSGEGPFTAQEWMSWIMEVEMPMAPEALQFLRAVEEHNIAYYDETRVVPVPSTPPSLRERAAARRAAEAAMPGLNVVCAGTEYGTQSYTEYSRWRGRVPIPLDVLRGGVERVREYVDEWIQDHTDMDDYSVHDDSTGDKDMSEFDREVQEYGDIQALIAQQLGVQDDDDEDADEEEEEDDDN